MKGKPRICILGTPVPNGNMGVEALAASLVSLLHGLHNKVEIIFLSGGMPAHEDREFPVGDDAIQVTFVRYRMSMFSNWRHHLLLTIIVAALHRILPVHFLRHFFQSQFPILQTLTACDWVGDIRGGDSFSDIYGFRVLFFGSLPTLLALVLGKPLVMLPQTIGPYKSRAAQILARSLIRRAAYIFTRDQASFRLATSLILHASEKRILFCPDVAFALVSKSVNPITASPPLPPTLEDEVVGINISGLLYHGGYNQRNMFGLASNYADLIHQVILYFAETHHRQVLLIPHMQLFSEWKIESDYHAAIQAHSRLPEAIQSQVFIISGPYNSHQFKYIIGRCDFFVGSRMHACIAALSQGIPTVGLAYSRKFVGVFATVDCANWVLDATSSSIGCIMQRMDELYLARHQKRECLPACIGSARNVTINALSTLFAPVI